MEDGMAQLSFFDFENTLTEKKSRKPEFLESLDILVPRPELLSLIAPFYLPTGKSIAPPPKKG